MKNELFLALTQLAAERNLPQSIVVSAVKEALASAYRKDPAAKGQDILVEVDSETGDVIVKTILNVKEKDEIEDPLSEISEEEAKKINKDLRVGDFIETGFMEYNPGRIAAQTAKQVVLQKLREAERDLVFGKFADKKGQVIIGTIQRIDSRNIFVDIGRANALMPPSEQTSYEKYRVGQQLKFYVTEVQRTARGPEIIVSRTHPELLRKLFESEVPEISAGVVEIKALSREAGARSKVAVSSEDVDVDAVGACVGLRGIRIQNVVNELLGEKIDVVDWSEDPKVLITNSLSPATVSNVSINPDDSSATVTVPKKQLSLAIGKEGQNARLAAKLTLWKIDVQAEEEVIIEQPDEVIEKVSETASVANTEEVSPNESSEAVQTIEEVFDETILEESPKAKTVDEEAELMALEKEIQELEQKEEDEIKQKKQKEDILDFSSEDIWNLDGVDSKDKSDETIRFAEDIESLNTFGSNNKNSKKSDRRKKNKR
ncbi:MAG: transcription termination/antitermination protein NusA [SAR202 cluster bacterium]|nr:transcription termination/antitermination protein NusA [Chloroflexota bacterium]MQF83405.1 transcription termination/antitermination protein NusA [SAR202 cluster bacterium]MEC7919335.1 transcription termination factor NusA [Chloroflexota bacterium]MEC9098865.1 transcription termination factor NusA [Chloroflexota bacterium]MEC9107897.1 transcription termination factor NusA [Chloroflexota bacterium]